MCSEKRHTPLIFLKGTPAPFLKSIPPTLVGTHLPESLKKKKGVPSQPTKKKRGGTRPSDFFWGLTTPPPFPKSIPPCCRNTLLP